MTTEVPLDGVKLLCTCQQKSTQFTGEKASGEKLECGELPELGLAHDKFFLLAVSLIHSPKNGKICLLIFLRGKTLMLTVFYLC